ncbi:CapA family protein [Intestinimonas sp.]|uniref:CapA family protein n=1 Tax=Intestinimonas sp. TaxID=1965293 RepID=UPI00262EC2CB|nr:CapA family protein [Intestinimonas sp.]
MDSCAVLYATGDIIIDEPDPHSFFAPSRDLLAGGDFVLGQIEVPHTDRGEANSTDIPAPPAAPANLDALVPCGFNLCTTAGNHAHDNGVPGIVDTIEHLRARGIAVTGSGRTLAEAKAPAVVTRKGVTVAVLAYNAVGPREGWATSQKAGVSYVNILTHHEPSPRATPGLPATIYTFPEPESLREMQADIAALRPQCDILLVALHKGMVHLDSIVQMYEVPLAHAAIDAGADAVIGHHAHILRGIEVYRGKPIYHNLGNFVCVTHALTPTAGNDSPERLAWIASRKKLFGFEPDMTMPYYPFNPDSRNTMLAKLVLTRAGVAESGYVPCYIDHAGAPVPLTTRESARPVIAYLQRLQQEEGFPCRMDWQEEGWVRVTQV